MKGHRSEDAEQKSAIGPFGQALLQLIPGDLELSFSAFVIKAIQTRVFHQDVQAVDESPRGRDPALSICVCRENTRLLEFQRLPR